MKKIFYLLVAAALLFSGAYIAYKKVESLNVARCLGCIAMEPKVEKFAGFWVEYPEYYKQKGIPQHPQWIVDEAKKKVVMLFFWFEGCEACKKQWENMKKHGMVEGSEADGSFTENYSYAILITIDIVNSKDKDILKIYHAKEKMEAPTTVILFEKNGTIHWYAFSGEANGKGGRPDINGLINILEEAKEEKYGGNL